MAKLNKKAGIDDIAVFHSAKVHPDVAYSHNAVYVRLGSRAANDAKLPVLLDGEVSMDSDSRKLISDGTEYDVINVKHIYPAYAEEAAKTGGVVAGDVTIDKDTVLENGLVVCGTLTVNPGVTLTLKKGDPLIAENARIGGHLLYDAPDFGFKPGHVVGPDADLDPERVFISGHTDFFADGARISGTGAVFFSNSADVQKDACFTGMVTSDEVTVRENVTVTTKDGCWLGWVHGVLEDGVTFHTSETEICVLEYIHRDNGAGYYDHTGFGTTKIGRNVKLIGDNSFCWFWMGDLDGRFADVRGNIVMKAKQLIQVNDGDLANFEVSPIFGSGTKEEPYTLTFHEKDGAYPYVTSRTLAVDAAVNNVVQEMFPDCVLFSIPGKLVTGYRDLRAGNILIHKVDDMDTLLYAADVVVYANET